MNVILSYFLCGTFVIILNDLVEIIYRKQSESKS